MHRLALAAAAFSLLTSSAAAQELLADANRDGKITPQEWDRAAASTRMDLEERGVDRAGLVGKGGWFQAMDANKDNAVTPAEIDAYTAARFKAKDPNGDGVITRGEAAQLEKTAAKKIN